MIDKSLPILTVRQPWASLLVRGFKTIENRTWQTKYRGRILIHASGKIDPKMKEGLSMFTGNQLDAIDNRTIIGIINNLLPTSAIIGEVTIQDIKKGVDNPWAEDGVFNWIVGDSEEYEIPMSGIKGKLNLWKL